MLRFYLTLHPHPVYQFSCMQQQKHWLALHNQTITQQHPLCYTALSLGKPVWFICFCMLVVNQDLHISHYRHLKRVKSFLVVLMWTPTLKSECHCMLLTKTADFVDTVRQEIWFVVCWLLNVPATCQCISGMDLLRQLYVLPHWDTSCRSNFPSHPVRVYWHRANQSQHWPFNARRLAG